MSTQSKQGFSHEHFRSSSLEAVDFATLAIASIAGNLAFTSVALGSYHEGGQVRARHVKLPWTEMELRALRRSGKFKPAGKVKWQS